MPDYLDTDTAPTVAPYGLTTEASGMTRLDVALLIIVAALSLAIAGVLIATYAK